MLDIILFYNLPFFVILSIPIIISEIFFKIDGFSEKIKNALRGVLFISLGVIIVNIALLLIEFVTAGNMVQYLISLTYSGQFTPTIEHIIIRTIFMTIRVVPWYIAFIFFIIIVRNIVSKPPDSSEVVYEEFGWRDWINYYFSNETVIYNRAIPLVAVVLINIWLLVSLFLNSFVLDISYVNQLPKEFLRSLNDIMFILFVIFSVYLPLKITKYRLQGVDGRRSRGYSLSDFEISIPRIYYWIFGLITGGLIVTLVLNVTLDNFHNFGESLYSGKATEFTIIAMIGFIILEIVLIVIALIIPLDKFGLERFKQKNVPVIEKYIVGAFIIISIVILTSFTVTRPFLTTTPRYYANQTAFSRIIIAENPIEDYPVNISQLRLVSGDLARDISKASPPSPPKPYTLSIMVDKDMVGMIDGRPSWIIPMKYESQFNPKANVIAGYVRVFLDDPIPEHIQIKFHEMQYGYGLNGYNDVKYLALKIMPDGFVGDDGISFIDPYNGEPAWLLRMSKYDEWGLEIPAGVLVIKGDGSYEKLTVEEASLFDPEAISDSVFMATADRAGDYIRSNEDTGEFEFDFSAKGLFTIPASPDRFIDIGIIVEEETEEINDFYLQPHHYLLQDGKWLGRIYYRKTTTSNIENVVAITIENDTMTMFDLREYERGGLKGVHTPNDVMDDLEDEFEEKLELKSGESRTKYRVRQPTLYRTIVQNDTVLVWVSLIIYSTQGADELRGALFVDAANTRIVGYTTRSIGESSEVFKQRLSSNIEQTYLSFGTDNDTAGETQTTVVENGTIIYHDWIGQDINNWKIYVMRIYDNDEEKEWLIFVRKNEAKTGQIYAMAASAMVGEHYSFSLRFDKDEQVYILYDMSTI